MVPPPTSATTTSTTSLWPSFDVSSKRPFQALYDHPSVLGAHMIGQSKAWLTSDSLHKRPRLESASNLPIYPQRPGEKDCTHYMLTRTCKFGDTCKFDHPIWVPEGGIPDWKEPPPVPYEFHPERPGAPDCPYFLKTQQCKFGLNCKFNHPKESSELPERPSEPLCSFYMKTGHCRFGVSCKFHHPRDVQVPSDGDTADNGVQIHSVDDLGGIGDKSAVKTFPSTPAPSYNSKGLPIRLGEVDCPFYLKTGSCKYGANCRYNHPDWNDILSPLSVINPVAAAFGLVPVMYPQRPGEIECDFYMKTGECKYGETCKYHHPFDRILEQNVNLTLAGLPRREGVQHCPFYMKTGTCSYGVTCKFDHPPPGEVMASAENDEETKEIGENV